MKRRILCSAIVVFGLSGCGGGVLAPEGAASNAFLDQVAANCGKLKIGNQPIEFLLDVNSSDVYFVDETSKLSAGQVDQSTYATDINAFYPTDTNQAALNCIFDQLD
ncbi:hypothetical protein [Thiocystis violacea]|uniref:hypothetical protein n=1 Tax=Thiocystis violacea TaxID=13725 RepID=UPI00190509DB|nr:hypothetical protein [Thiocystis violacea]MBK1722997.1 hypothetical protein [Thiocystis violacea]